MNIVLLAVMVLAALAFVLGPLRLAKPGAPAAGPSKLVELEREKARLLESIREFEFDRDMGKVLDDDYETTMARHRADAVAVMKKIDALRPQHDVEALIDEEIGRIKRQLKRASAV